MEEAEDDGRTLGDEAVKCDTGGKEELQSHRAKRLTLSSNHGVVIISQMLFFFRLMCQVTVLTCSLR